MADAKATYVKADALAKIFGFDGARRIQQLTQDGVISTVEVTEGGRKARRYDLLPTVRKYVVFLREKANGKKQDLPTAEEAAEADLRYRKAKAEIMELKAAELKGQMHRSEDVEAVTNAIVATLRSEILALPGALAVDAADADTPAMAASVIKGGVNDMLNRMAAYRYDPAAYERLVMEREKWMGDKVEGDTEKS